MVEQVAVQRYLDRIAYVGPRDPTLDVLRGLHLRHMLSVPFENLDIHMGTPIVLDTKAFLRKIVEEQRGGYCYELNGSFCWLLKKLGFKVSMLSARVAGRDGNFSPEFDHMTLLVRLNQRWLVDVGFGDSFTKPKKIDDSRPQRDRGYAYKIEPDDTERRILRKSGRKNLWTTQYSFKLKPRRLLDFVARNRYQQTSPNSHFTHGRLISKLTSTGRITLTDKKLILTKTGSKIERTVKNDGEFLKLLAKYFTIRSLEE